MEVNKQWHTSVLVADDVVVVDDAGVHEKSSRALELASVFDSLLDLRVSSIRPMIRFRCKTMMLGDKMRPSTRPIFQNTMKLYIIWTKIFT